MATLGNGSMISRFAQDPALGGSAKQIKMVELVDDIIGSDWTNTLVHERKLTMHTGAYQTVRFKGTVSPAQQTRPMTKHQLNNFNLLDEKNFNALRFTSAFYLEYQEWAQAVQTPEVDLAREYTKKNAESIVRMQENSVLIMLAYAYQTRTLPTGDNYVDIYTADSTGTTPNPLFCPPANPHTYMGVAAQATMPPANITPSQQGLIQMHTLVSQFRDDKQYSLRAKPRRLITSSDWGPLWSRELANEKTPDSADNADNINKYLGYKREVVVVDDLPLQTTIIETSLCEKDPASYKINRTRLTDDIVTMEYDKDIQAWKYLISTFQRLQAPAGWAGYFTTSAS